MSGQHVRIGVVGTSWWTETVHLPALASHSQAEVVAICGRNRKRTGQIARQHAITGVFTDYREMFSSGLPDAVVIATPDDLHPAMALDALASGLHVLCEKPLARTAADARQMLDTAEASGRVHMMMFTWRWLGVFAYLHTLIEDGYLGRCRDAHFLMHADYADAASYQWRYDPARGSGIIGDFGSHLIDLARWCIGDITQVSAHQATHVARQMPGHPAAESLGDSAGLIVDFAGGAQGTIEISDVHLVGDLPSFQARVYGDSGSLEADVDLLTHRLRGRRRGGSSWNELPVPPTFTAANGQHPAIQNLPILAPLTNLPVGDRLFVDAVLAGRPVRPTFEDGWRTQQVVDAAQRSIREHRWITVE